MHAQLGDLDQLSRGLIASVADLALVVDQDGIVTDLWLGEPFEEQKGWQSLVGQPWAETVLPDSQTKAKELVERAFAGERVRSREVNQSVEGVGAVPLRANAIRVDDDRVVITGRDIRPVAEMQQRLVSAQQSMDLEYRRLRRAGTAYRVLFRVCSDAVLVVRDSDHQIVEVNPAAASLLGAPVETIRGKSLEDLFSDDSRDELFTLLGAVEAGASSEVELRPSGRDDVAVTASASRFRQSGTLLMLFRFWATNGQAPEASARRSRMMKALEVLPDGFVVTDEDLHILNANAAFCELVQRSTEQTVEGFHLGRWLGRPGVDLKIITASMRENGMIRDFSTIVRGEFGQTQEALVTAVEALDGEVPCYGFTLRTVETRMMEPENTSILPRSADRLRSLVGRVSLKDIVQESTDLIERLCIEAALEVSGNNRAAAAALLGLSRQSLYSKLRRYGLGDYQ